MVCAGHLRRVVLFAFTKGIDRRGKVLLVINNLLIIGSVFGEYHFGSKASQAATYLQLISRQKTEAFRVANPLSAAGIEAKPTNHMVDLFA